MLQSIYTATILLAILATSILCAPAPVPLPTVDNKHPSRPNKCLHPLKRKAWHTLSNREKKSYLDAELCLMSRPSTSGLGAAVSRFDDLVKAHQVQAELVHADGLFLPFHRLFVTAHEELLRNECAYHGAQPWWDETAEAGNFHNSVIFDTKYGFGGDGHVSQPGQENNATAPKCIDDGPFKDYVLHTGPGHLDTEHCITRKINDTKSLQAGPSEIAKCTALPNYDQAWQCFFLAPHGGGHGGVGGEMGNAISSPGDPIFYLHHAFLDRVWWNWQAADLPRRLTDIAGYTTRFEPATGWVNATLADELNMFGVVRNATVGEVMKGGRGEGCVEYIDP